MELNIKYGAKLYVIVDAERIDEGILLPGGRGNKVYVKTELESNFVGYYGKTVFITREKAEAELKTQAAQKKREAETQKYLRETAEKRYKEGKKIGKCEICGTESPRFERKCDCVPYIR